MTTLLCLLRHGRAAGQGPDAMLYAEGEAWLRTLGHALAREGFVPVAAYASPYRRARDTANIVLGELGSSVPLVLLHELVPEGDPHAALDALETHGLPDGSVLVVSHLPLVARLAEVVANATEDFQPGTFVEIEVERRSRSGVFRRTIAPGDPLP